MKPLVCQLCSCFSDPVGLSIVLAAHQDVEVRQARRFQRSVLRATYDGSECIIVVVVIIKTRSSES